MISVLALVVSIGAGPAGGPGRTLQDRYDEGARRYWAGEVHKAYDTWEELTEYDLRSPGLFYALGNASYRLGRPGEARAWYERALLLAPHDGDVRANLQTVGDVLQQGAVVRVIRRGAAAGEGSFEWWYHLFTRLTPGQLAVLFLLFHWLFFGVLVARRWMAPGVQRALLTWGNVPVLIAALSAGILLSGAAYVDSSVDVAVVTASPTPMREGPTREAAVLFELPEGQLVRLSEGQDGWRRARMNDDLQGWIAVRNLMGAR